MAASVSLTGSLSVGGGGGQTSVDATVQEGYPPLSRAPTPPFPQPLSPVLPPRPLLAVKPLELPAAPNAPLAASVSPIPDPDPQNPDAANVNPSVPVEPLLPVSTLPTQPEPVDISGPSAADPSLPLLEPRPPLLPQPPLLPRPVTSRNGNSRRPVVLEGLFPQQQQRLWPPLPSYSPFPTGQQTQAQQDPIPQQGAVQLDEFPGGGVQTAVLSSPPNTQAITLLASSSQSSFPGTPIDSISVNGATTVHDKNNTMELDSESGHAPIDRNKFNSSSPVSPVSSSRPSQIFTPPGETFPTGVSGALLSNPATSPTMGMLQIAVPLSFMAVAAFALAYYFLFKKVRTARDEENQRAAAWKPPTLYRRRESNEVLISNLGDLVEARHAEEKVRYPVVNTLRGLRKSAIVSVFGTGPRYGEMKQIQVSTAGSPRASMDVAQTKESLLPAVVAIQEAGFAGGEGQKPNILFGYSVFDGHKWPIAKAAGGRWVWIGGNDRVYNGDDDENDVALLATMDEAQKIYHIEMEKWGELADSVFVENWSLLFAFFEQQT
ncbi:hypothetical protein BC830DRAFT_1076770 [Chytriomyces sp. MP71]|nr:hypothetical protein BC830DRAFT_1076770 [Chytriomyces sp. MP71]